MSATDEPNGEPVGDAAADAGGDLDPTVEVVCMVAGALDTLGPAFAGPILQIEAQLDETGRWTNVLWLRCALGNFSVTVEPLETPSVTCPRCGATSWNPKDVAEGYCGRCHDWTSRRKGGAR